MTPEELQRIRDINGRTMADRTTNSLTMELTANQIELWEALAERMTTREMAHELGISRPLVRKTMSQHGIVHPRRKADIAKRETIRKHYGKGEPSTIAQFLDLSTEALRKRIERMHLRQPHPELFNEQHARQ
jgi:hypothetical protein